MQPLVPADQLIAEGQARHKAPLLQPKDGTEAAAEVDAFHTGKGQQPLRKALAAADPPAAMQQHHGTGQQGA